MNDKSQLPTTGSDDADLKSMFYEQLVEHVFVSEVSAPRIAAYFSQPDV